MMHKSLKQEDFKEADEENKISEKNEEEEEEEVDEEFKMSFSREIYEFRSKQTNPLVLNRQESINKGPIKQFINMSGGIPLYSSSD